MFLYNEDFQKKLQREAGDLFNTALWGEIVKKIGEKRRSLADSLETTRLNEPNKVLEFVKIQGQINGIDITMRILQDIINLGPLPGVSKDAFPRIS